MSNIQSVFDRLAGLAKEQELRKQEATQLKYQVKQRQIDRAIKNQEPTVATSVRLPKSELEKLKQLSSEFNVTPSDVMRETVKEVNRFLFQGVKHTPDGE